MILLWKIMILIRGLKPLLLFKMKAIIAAMTKERVIGRDNKLPWNIPEDLINFKRLTLNNTVIMGRKTYESIPKKFRPLPKRHNIILSRSMNAIGIDVARSFEEALRIADSYGNDIFFIGGPEIYRQALSFADTMFISYIKKNYEGDTYFPKFDQKNWRIEERHDFADFELIVYKK